jgi:hypothetical protein
MLLRLWMILVLAVYPALAGWTPPAHCPSSGDAGRSITTESTGCCAAPTCASQRACCTAATRDGQPRSPKTADEGGEGGCPLLGRCRGPCRSAPGSPLGPPVRREHQPQPEQAPQSPIFSEPMVAGVEAPLGRACDWPLPRIISVSQRLSLICIRTT